MTDIERTRQNLAFIRGNPDARFPAGWISQVHAEARTLGLLPPLKSFPGCNCRPDIDAKIVYGGDRPD